MVVPPSPIWWEIHHCVVKHCSYHEAKQLLSLPIQGDGIPSLLVWILLLINPVTFHRNHNHLVEHTHLLLTFTT